MKKLILVSIVVIICFSLTGKSVYSAENQKGIYVYEYKKELSLTDKQEKNLKDILVRFQGYVENKQKNINELRAELNKMIAENGDLAKIKAKINNLSKIQADVTYERIASNRAVEAELSEIQLSKWRGIQAEFAKNLQQALNAAAQAKEIKK